MFRYLFHLDPLRGLLEHLKFPVLEEVALLVVEGVEQHLL